MFLDQLFLSYCDKNTQCNGELISWYTLIVTSCRPTAAVGLDRQHIIIIIIISLFPHIGNYIKTIYNLSNFNHKSILEREKKLKQSL